jgi:uncharacterized protein
MSDVPRNPYESPNPPPVPPEATDIQPVLSSDAKNLAMLCHLLAFTVYLTVVGHIVGPLLLWLWKKDEEPFVDEHGKESLNFQISMSIYTVLLIPTVCVGIGIVLLPVLGIVDAVLVIIAALKAANGEHYQYPLTIRFLK